MKATSVHPRNKQLVVTYFEPLESYNREWVFLELEGPRKRVEFILKIIRFFIRWGV